MSVLPVLRKKQRREAAAQAKKCRYLPKFKGGQRPDHHKRNCVYVGAVRTAIVAF